MYYLIHKFYVMMTAKGLSVLQQTSDIVVSIFSEKKNDRADKKMIQTQISNSAIFLIFPITLEKNKEERETFSPHSLISFH